MFCFAFCTVKLNFTVGGFGNWQRKITLNYCICADVMDDLYLFAAPYLLFFGLIN